MKSDKKKVYDYFHKTGILQIYRNLKKIYDTTNDNELKLKLEPVLKHIAIPLSISKKPKKELLLKGSLKLDMPPYSLLLDYVDE